jgi:hypothetical protein
MGGFRQFGGELSVQTLGFRGEVVRSAFHEVANHARGHALLAGV